MPTATRATARRSSRTAFDDAILVIDRDTDRVPMADRADLVALAATETESIHRGIDTRIQHSGNGYRVQVPATGTRLQAGDGLRATPRRASSMMAPLDADAGTRRLLETRRTQALDTEADADD